MFCPLEWEWYLRNINCAHFITTSKAYQCVPYCVAVNFETNFRPGAISFCETPGTPSDHDVPCCLFFALE